MDNILSLEIMRSPWNWALVLFVMIVLFGVAGLVHNMKGS